MGHLFFRLVGCSYLFDKFGLSAAPQTCGGDDAIPNEGVNPGYQENSQ
ncbi:hypothetical protein [Hymenobacter terricola]|nr:hypothetical protein [Hymenobacter terricola]